MRLKRPARIGLGLEIVLVVVYVLFELEPKVFWPLALIIGVIAAIEGGRPTRRQMIDIKAKDDVVFRNPIPEGTDLRIQTEGGVIFEGARVVTFDWRASLLVLVLLLLVAFLGFIAG